MPRKPLADRFQRFFDKTDACWLWQGAVNGAGYGTIGVGTKAEGKEFAHGMLVCHTCDVKICVNPNHLFLGTYQDNVDDMIRKGRNPRGESWLTPARVAGQVKGEKHGRSKLKREQVILIFKRFTEDKKNKAQIAKEFGVSRAMVRNIINGKNWAHLSLAGSVEC